MTSDVLVDTSALLHLVRASYEGRGDEFLGRYRATGNLVIAPQCLIEFYSVATRPAESRGGMGLSSATGLQLIRDLRDRFDLRPEPPDLLDRWTDLVAKREIVGRASHDARLAAFALGEGIERVLTLDRGGFARFGLEEIAP